MKKITLFVTGALALSAAPAAAQVFTPTFMSPYTANELGVYVNDGPGDLGIEASWRRGGPNYDLGIRVGYADIGDGALTAGVELRNPVVLAGAPIGLAFTAGAQGIVGDDVTGIGGQLGFSAGYRFAPEANFTLTPYIHPRLAVVSGFGEGDDDVELDVLADVGVDVGFNPGVSFRFAANLGAGVDWGIGLAFRQ